MMLADTVIEVLKRDPVRLIHDNAHQTILAATDAGADDITATVGGWYSHNTCPSKSEVHWFYMEIIRKSYGNNTLGLLKSSLHNNPSQLLSSMEPWC